MTYERVGANTAETAELAKEIWYEHYMQFIPPDMVRGMVASHQSAEAIAEKISEGYEYFIIRDGETAAGYFAIKNTETGLYLDKAYLKKRACEVISVNFPFVINFKTCWGVGLMPRLS